MIGIVALIIDNLHAVLLQYYLKIYTETFYFLKKYYSLRIYFELKYLTHCF